MPIAVFKNQQFVRAGEVSFIFDDRVEIDSFTVCAISKDTCVIKEVKNISNKISDKVHQLFSTLKPEDVIIFKKIYARRQNGHSIELEPVMVTVY
jgi:hypothetical protein